MELILQPIRMDAVLCYVEHGYAYFTTQPLAQQWGDDWDDAPYEHNAGRPYEPHPKANDGRTWEIYELAYSADLQTPAEHAGGNSSYSVQAINLESVAWLSPDPCTRSREVIHAGATVAEFVAAIHRSGGRVFMQVQLAGS